MTETPQTEVLYNGACPICRREVDTYRRIAEREGLEIRFHDLNGTDLAGWGISADQARRRLHLREGGAVLAGLPAFVALWRRMPGFGWLARLVGLPGLRWLAEAVYERALAPALAGLDRWRRRRGVSPSPERR